MLTCPHIDSKFLSRVLSITNENDAYAAMIKVFEVLSNELEKSAYLLMDEDSEKIPLKSLTDIVVYSYLREAIDSVPNSEAIKELLTQDRFAGVSDYRKRFETHLADNKLKLELPTLDAKAIVNIGEKYVHKRMKKFSLGNRLLYKNEDEEPKLIKIAKWGAYACTILGFTLINLGNRDLSGT